MTEPVNPYRPPSAELSDPNTFRAAPPATKGRRFGTMVIDYLCFLFATILFGVVLGVTFGEQALTWMEGPLGNVIGLPIFLGYYAFFEAVWFRTPGKLVMGTIVVNEEGGPPTFRQILVRSLCRMIPFEAFSAFGDRPWHDSIPKTRVVRTRPA